MVTFIITKGPLSVDPACREYTEVTRGEGWPAGRAALRAIGASSKTFKDEGGDEVSYAAYHEIGDHEVIFHVYP